MINYELLSDLGFTSNNNLQINVNNVVVTDNTAYGLLMEIDSSNAQSTLQDIDDSFKYLASQGYTIKMFVNVSTELVKQIKIGTFVDVTSTGSRFIFPAFVSDTLVMCGLTRLFWNNKYYIAIAYSLT